MFSDALRIAQHLSKIRNKLKRLYTVAAPPPPLTVVKKITKTLTDLSYIYIIFFQRTMRRRPVNPEIYYAYRNLKNVLCLSARVLYAGMQYCNTSCKNVNLFFFPQKKITPYVTATRFWACYFLSRAKRVDDTFFEVLIKTRITYISFIGMFLS